MRQQQPPRVSPRSGTAPPVAHQFRPGVSGNPRGRPSAGMSIREWWNQMQDWTTAQVQAVVDDPNSPAVKVAAARTLLHACSSKLTKGGMPVAGPDLDRILDYTSGRPTKSVAVKVKNAPLTVEEGAARADRLLREIREHLGIPVDRVPGSG